jgi:hypothetical protein
MRDATRSAMIDRQIEALKGFKGKKVQVGWFETDRYPAEEGESVGKSIAEVARLLEFGGTIQHPGGTTYIDDAIVKGKGAGARFVNAKTFEGQETKKTKPHAIVIPPRPFMRLAARNFMSKRTAIQATITNKAMKGEITAAQALARVGLVMENEVVKSMKNGNWIPNAPSTIARKGFDKPLIETGLMWKSVSSKVS